MAGRVRESGRWGSGARGVAGGLGGGGTERGWHLGGADGGIRVDGWAGGILGRLVAHVDGGVVGVGGASVFVDGGLHLLQNVVDLLEVILGAEVGHGREIVVLGQGPGRAADSESVRGLRHVLGGEAAGLDAQVSVDGHERAADVLVRGRVDLTTLHAAEEVVELVKATLGAVRVKRGGLVGHVVTARAHGLLGVVDGMLVVGLLLVGGMLMVVTSLTILVRLAKRGRVSTAHLAIVIIEAGRSYRGGISLESSKRRDLRQRYGTGRGDDGGRGT